jgi:DNA-binding transcriptional regulator LsrR (DeoR family)
MIEHAEIEEVKRGGGSGELLGHFFDDRGRPVETALSDRVLALTREQLKGRKIVAVAGGKVKIRAIRSVLASGYLSGLITDERTARALVEETPVRKSRLAKSTNTNGGSLEA